MCRYAGHLRRQEIPWGTVVEPIVMDVHLPPGVAGPDPLDFDVRCYLVTTANGVALVDVGMAGSHDAIGAALMRVGAEWNDITDVFLTHSHPDHVGGLADIVASAGGATIWVGDGDRSAIPFDGEMRSLVEGGTAKGLRTVQTPGHTPGHCSFVLEAESILFAGDIVGSMAGSLSRGPAAFTADAEQAEKSLQRVAGLEFDRVLFGHGAEIPDPLGELRRLLRDPT
jgi:glyoxylase-like metal-dependent hydrolase (beta-lactamase superfamily II)